MSERVRLVPLRRAVDRVMLYPDDSEKYIALLEEIERLEIAFMYGSVTLALAYLEPCETGAAHSWVYKCETCGLAVDGSEWEGSVSFASPAAGSVPDPLAPGALGDAIADMAGLPRVPDGTEAQRRAHMTAHALRIVQDVNDEDAAVTP